MNNPLIIIDPDGRDTTNTSTDDGIKIEYVGKIDCDEVSVNILDLIISTSEMLSGYGMLNKGKNVAIKSLGSVMAIKGAAGMEMSAIKLYGTINGVKATIPGGIGEFTDKQMGGDGKTGELFDATVGDVPKTPQEALIFSYGVLKTQLCQDMLSKNKQDDKGSYSTLIDFSTQIDNTKTNIKPMSQPIKIPTTYFIKGK